MALAWTPSARLKQVALERAQPLSASLELTYRCNWRCVFCYNPRHHDRRGLSSAELAERSSTSCGSSARSTSRSPAASRSPTPSSWRSRAACASARFALRILTNGALVTEALAAEIAALLPMAVELSLHGACAETHDRATATPGSFDAMLRGLDRLLRNAGRGRAQDAAHAPQRGRDGRDAADRGRARRAAAPRPGAHAARRRRPGAARLPGFARRRGPDVPGARRPRARSRARTASRAESNCGLGRTTLAIDPEGNVFPCLQWRRAPLGNVRDDPAR